MGVVQIRNGDMFDGPSDLVVLPCSTGGTVTSFVRQKLSQFRIPSPKSRLELGDVQLLPFKGGESIAQYVAFAASVRAFKSNLDAISRIGERLGRYTRKLAGIRRVGAPLLGTGAGGLVPREALKALSSGFHSNSVEGAVLIVSVLDPSLFARLTKTSKKAPAAREVRETRRSHALRVFISYSYGTGEHTKWVKNFATFLRGNGIDARLDMWHLRAGMDLPQFMALELAQAQRVVVISDERYAQKANGRLGGVGWETMLIQGDLLSQPAHSQKYLALVRSKRIADGIPDYMKTKFVIHWPEGVSSKTKRNMILRELYDRISIPPIGPRPVFVP